MSWRAYQRLQKVAELGERFMSFIDYGQVDPVICLHGIPTWGYLWHRLLPKLSRSHRVLIPDLLGFGYSDKRDCFDRSIARQTEWLVLWMDLMKIDRAHLIAHDLGGGIAQRIATLHPSRVKSLTLLNSVGYDSWPIEWMLQLGHPEMDRILSAQALRKVLLQGLKAGFSTRPSAELLESLIVPYTTEVGKLSLIRAAAALNTNLTQEIAHRLPQIRVPTLILWGEDDRFQPIRYGRRLARDIAGAQLIPIRDASHFVMLDQPEAVIREILAFLPPRSSLESAPLRAA